MDCKSGVERVGIRYESFTLINVFSGGHDPEIKKRKAIIFFFNFSRNRTAVIFVIVFLEAR